MFKAPEFHYRLYTWFNLTFNSLTFLRERDVKGFFFFFLTERDVKGSRSFLHYLSEGLRLVESDRHEFESSLWCL